MPAAGGTLFAPFTKLHLQPPSHRICMSSRAGRDLLQLRYKNPSGPSFSSTRPYTRLPRYPAIAHNSYLHHRALTTHSGVAKPSALRPRKPFETQSRNFKLTTISPHPSGPYSRPQYSTFASLKTLIAVSIIAGALILQSLYSGRIEDSTRISKNHYKHLNSDEVVLFQPGEKGPKMIEETLAGRPGNLTPEQEEKLREIWIATLVVFGVIDSHRAQELNGSGHVIPPAGSHPLSEAEKPKKKRLSLFGRKHKESDNDSVTPTDLHSPGLPLSPGVAGDSDDKYGQTKQFHETLAQQTPESLRAAFWSMVKHDHPDALLLRFLRARKWDVEKALVMMVSTMHWRDKEMHVDDDIMKSGEEGALVASHSSNPSTKRSGDDFLAQMRMGKSFLHGVDKAGRSMCFVRVRLHKQGEQMEESLERYTVFVIESARILLTPPADTACIVFDMTGFSLSNMDYAPVKFMIKCFEANYPESLGVVLVHKAPWVFQGIWKIIKGWLDPVVASKVHFTNNVGELEEFVPKIHIPKDLGGEENWSYHYIEPVANENEMMKDTDTRDKLLAEREVIVKEYEKATLDWIEHRAPLQATEIKANRHRIAAHLKEDYWKLDPYLRARSFYDRTGMIQPGGGIHFYQPAHPSVSASTVNGVHKVEPSADDVD